MFHSNVAIFQLVEEIDSRICNGFAIFLWLGGLIFDEMLSHTDTAPPILIFKANGLVLAVSPKSRSGLVK